MFVFSNFFYGLFPLDFWILKGEEFHFEETKSKISSEKTKLSFFEKWDVALLAPLIYPTPGLLSKSWQSYRIYLKNLPFSQKNKKRWRKCIIPSFFSLLYGLLCATEARMQLLQYFYSLWPIQWGILKGISTNW